jgi:hypothetical protein
MCLVLGMTLSLAKGWRPDDVDSVHLNLGIQKLENGQGGI